MVPAGVHVRLLPLCADPECQRVHFHPDHYRSKKVQGGGQAVIEGVSLAGQVHPDCDLGRRISFSNAHANRT